MIFRAFLWLAPSVLPQFAFSFAVREYVDVQERNNLYATTMGVGTGTLERVLLWTSLAMQQLTFWLLSGCLAVAELSTLRVV